MESGGLERVSRRLYANPKEADAVYALLPPQWAAKAKEVTGPIVSGRLRPLSSTQARAMH